IVSQRAHTQFTSSHRPYHPSVPRSIQPGSKNDFTASPSSMIPYAAPRRRMLGHPVFHRTAVSRITRTPEPYNQINRSAATGFNHSSGGVEPDSISAMTGERRIRARSGRRYGWAGAAMGTALPRPHLKAAGTKLPFFDYGVLDLHISPEVPKVQTRIRTTPAIRAEKAPLTGAAATRARIAARIPTYPSQRGNGLPRIVTKPYTPRPAARTRKPKISTEPSPMTAWATMTAVVLETPPVAYALESTSSVTVSLMKTTAVTTIPTSAKRVAEPTKRRSFPLKALRNPMKYGTAKTAASPMKPFPTRNAVRRELNWARVASA